MVENLYIHFLNTSYILQLCSLGSVCEIMFITEECKIPEKKHNACASQRMSIILYIHIHTFGHRYIKEITSPRYVLFSSGELCQTAASASLMTSTSYAGLEVRI
jgi:hypothetical protein